VARGDTALTEHDYQAASPGAITIVIARRDRWDIAELLLNESMRVEAEARSRRRNSPIRTALLDRAARLYELSVTVRP
jgi:hypothetical protein